jgi:hypothetical protein
MDNLSDILSHRDFDTPPEITAIKDYVRRHHDCDVQVTMLQRSIMIKARSAALITTLRLNGPAIQRAANTEKRLVFRIG